jgi:hypothetical protein
MLTRSLNRSLLVFVAGLVFVSALGAAASEYDPYGGWLMLKGKKTGFFHTQQINGRWWLVTPEGNVFFSKGVNHVSPAGDGGPRTPRAPASDSAQWAEATAEQLRGWGFNTIGGWGDPQMYAAHIAYTVMVGAARTARRLPSSSNEVPDYFSEEFRTSTDGLAQKLCAPRANDPWLLGYFTDNEQAWTTTKMYATWRIKAGNGENPPWNLLQSFLETYLKMPPTSAGYKKANEYLKMHRLKMGAYTEDDIEGFQELVAAEYARVCREAIRRYDPNHLILGCRYASTAPDPVVRGMGPYFDVISFNNYLFRPPVLKLERITEITGKPTLLTEFSFKAMDSGLPNTRGGGEPVATQQDRVDGFTQYVHDLVALPTCVGYHWFEYRDEPAEGRRGDGENSNYGLVKIDGAPWELLTAHMKEVNAGLEKLAVQKKKAGSAVPRR